MAALESSEHETGAFVVLELHDVTLVEAVLRVDGLAEPYEVNVQSRAFGRTYVFVLRGCEDATSCRGVLSYGGDEHVLFDGADLKAAAEALAEDSGDPPAPIAVDWPADAFEPEPEPVPEIRGGGGSEPGDEMFFDPDENAAATTAHTGRFEIPVTSTHRLGNN